MTTKEVKDYFRVPGIEDCYLLLCDGTPVNVRSQQVRALNLLHALNPDRRRATKLETSGSRSLAAEPRGSPSPPAPPAWAAKVTLFEKSPQLLHMQLGCWHRPLHPEIFSWPSDTAYRPVSHLPQLGWTTGRAHDVADTLLAQFGGIRGRLKEAEGPAGLLRYDGPGNSGRAIIPHDATSPSTWSS